MGRELLYGKENTLKRLYGDYFPLFIPTNFGTYRYTTASNEMGTSFTGKLNTIFRQCIVGFDYAQNIVVIHTLPGLASAAGSAIDSMHMSVVVGTLAGDDTVFVVMRDNNAAAAFCGEIKTLMM